MIELDPTPPFLIRQRLRLRTQRRNARHALGRLLRRIGEQLDPPPEVLARARAARHPSVVEDGYAQGRADLQLVHVAPGRAVVDGVNLGPARTRPSWVEDLP